MGKKSSYSEVRCEGDYELEQRDGFDSKHLIAEVDEQGALEGLREVICQHAQRGAELNCDDSLLDEIVDPKVTDVDMAGLFGSGTATLYELNSALIILKIGEIRGQKIRPPGFLGF